MVLILILPCFMTPLLKTSPLAQSHLSLDHKRPTWSSNLEEVVGQMLKTQEGDFYPLTVISQLSSPHQAPQIKLLLFEGVIAHDTVSYLLPLTPSEQPYMTACFQRNGRKSA